MKKNILAMAAATLLVAGSANASFILYLDDLGTAGTEPDIIVQDDTIAGLLTSIGATTDADANLTEGQVSYTGSLNNFIFNFTLGTSKPFYSAPGTIFDLFSLNISGGTGILEIGLTDTDFVGDQALNFGIGGTTDGAVSVAAYLDQGNAEFGTGTELGSSSGLTGLGFSYNSSTTYLSGSTDPYSLTIVTTIDHSNTGQNVTPSTSFDAAISVPEPSILALFGLGLAGIGFAGRRRQVK